MTLGDSFESKAVDEEEKIFEIKNVDFGIIQRPKQEIQLEKRIKKLSIILPNGSTLIDAEVQKDADGNYKLTDASTYVTYLPKRENNEGKLKVEIDKEIIQGSTLKMEYEFIINNISEVDYISEDYYKYGERKTEDKEVELSPKKLIDYVNDQVIITDEQNNVSDWKLQEDIGKLFEESTYGGEKLKLLSDKLKDYLKNINKVYILELKDISLKPGDEPKVVATMETSRILSNSNSLQLENNAEIIQTTKTGGSKIQSTHGNYNPSDTATYENDSDTSEDILILQPTGENRNYTIYIIIGIVTLTMMGIILVVIKKKVLK